ncbi:MAG: hypothetical protein RQ729_01275 [Wenzhouxiangellaceae bacterium]|nr:hypothetical protein [Wenzhouxiangellaceae bacterium]
MRWIAPALLVLAAFGPVRAQTATYIQQIDLQPGWNAIHVEVEPLNNQIATVFADVPVASVWRWLPPEVGARFIEDPAEGLQNIEGWFAWFPEPRPEAFLSNLFRINANTAYLVHVEGTQSHRISLTGRPLLVPQRWETNRFTLTGLPVALQNAPTFAEYFAPSAAHRDQPVYRLRPNGRWEVVNKAATPVRAGEAYWIFTQGNSRYQGRLQPVLEQGESIEFAAALDQINLVLRNRSELPGSFRIRRIGGNNMPLSFLNEDPETGERGWPFLPGELVLDAPAGENVFLSLGAVRRNFTASRVEEVLEVTDELGERVLVHVGANTLQPFVAPTPAQGVTTAAGKLAAEDSVPGRLAGLWLGEVEVNAVSESQLAGVIPEPVDRPFAQRFIIHVDSAGQARLLKDVIQMWEDGTEVPSAANPDLTEVETPGRYVLITDPALLSLFSGAINRDGVPVGQRFSTVAYDFEGDAQLFDGRFEPGEQISTTMVIGSELPTNPFLHRFHPDHDNRDAQFLNFRQEAYQVVREMRLILVEQDPRGTTPPGWGETLVGGFFEESITGLHKNTIFTSGEFRLRRISSVPVLNQ